MAPEPEVDDSERFEGRITLDDILAAFELVDETVYTSSDIAEVVGCSRESARQKLTRLFDQGRINRRKHGRFMVWWRIPPEEVEEQPERQLERLSQQLNDPIVVRDIVYTDGDSRVLSDAQTETVESAIEEGLSDE
jgi:predicted transcriptional regulator